MEPSDLRARFWEMSPEELEQVENMAREIRRAKLDLPDFDERLPEDVKHLVADVLAERRDYRSLGRLSRVSRSFRDVSSRQLDRLVRLESDKKEFEKAFVYLQPLLDAIGRIKHRPSSEFYVKGLEAILPRALALENPDEDPSLPSNVYIRSLKKETGGDPAKLIEWYNTPAPDDFRVQAFVKRKWHKQTFEKGDTMREVALFLRGLRSHRKEYYIELLWRPADDESDWIEMTTPRFDVNFGL